VWDDTSATITDKPVTITIKQKTPSLSFGPTNFETGWEMGQTRNVYVKSSDIDTGDNIKIKFTFTCSTNSGNTVSLSYTMVADNSNSTPEMVATWNNLSLSYGTYTATAEIEQATGTDYANYTAATASYPQFTVAPASVGSVTVQWKYTLNGANEKNGPVGVNTSQTAFVVGSYANQTYSFTIDETALPSGIVMDKTNGTGYTYTGPDTTDRKAAGDYSVTVTLKSNDPSVSFTTTSYTLYFTIAKLQFDLSKVGWDYTSFTYDGNAKTVNVTGLDKVTAYDPIASAASSVTPATLTATISGDSSKTNAGTGYSATATFACSDSNFEVPVATATGGTQNYVYSNSGATVFPFTLTWAIDKAKLDISNVKWNWELSNFTYTGSDQIVKLYEKGTAPSSDTAAVNAELPAGLIAVYNGVTKGNSTKDGGTADVTFKLSTNTYNNADGSQGVYADNYLVPVESDTNSYIGSSNFTWHLTWTIGPAELNTTWATYPVYDKNGNYYAIAVLQDDSGNPMLDKTLDPSSNSVVEYTYYKDQACTQSIPYADITVDVGNGITYYYAKVAINSANTGTYTLKGTTVQSFEVGDSKKPVTITVTGNVYNGEQQAANVQFTATNVVSNPFTSSDLIVEYYLTQTDRTNGTNKMTTLPIDAGDYYLKITIDSSKSNDYVIVGSSSFTYTIEKAKLDLTNVLWNWEIDNFKFTNAEQTVTLFESGKGNSQAEKDAELPAGLIATYSGKQKGKLTTDSGTVTVSFSLSTSTYTLPNGNSGQYNVNYELPVQGDTSTYIFDVANAANGNSDFTWTLSWTIDPAEIAADWTTYTVQDKNGNYYDIAVIKDSNGPILDKTLDPKSNSVIEYKYYKTADCLAADEIKFADIVVDVGNGITDYYAKVLVTSANSSVYTITGTDVKMFEVGDNKSPVTITVTNNIYNTQPQAANINIVVTGNAVTLSDLIVDYYPTQADRTAKTNALTSMPVDAGDYYLNIALNTTASGSYVIVGSSEYTYTIEKKQLDVTNIAWNYDAANPYEYTLKGGVEQIYEVKLTGYTDTELDNMFVYSDNTGSSVYSYTKTKYEISMTASDRLNYDLVSIDSAGVVTVLTDADVYKICPQSLSWEIIARQLVKPADNTLTFDDLDHDLLAMSGIDANSDWSEYLTLTITKDGVPYEDAVGNLNTLAHYAGTYVLTFSFTSAAATNAGWAKGDGTVDHYNVTVNCVVDKLTLTLTGWKNNPPEPKFDGTVGSNFYQVVYEKVSDGTRMDRATALTCEGEACIAYVEPATGLEDSVVVAAQTPMIPLQKTYKYSSQQPVYLTKPTLSAAGQELAFTGSAIDITAYLENYDATTMFVDGDVQVTNAGTYKVVVGIQDGLNAFWNGEDNWDSFEIEYSVDKGVIKVNWDTTGKIPVLKLPNGVEVDYTYYDEAGNAVETNEMVNENDYVVVANLSDEDAVNYTFEEEVASVAVLSNIATDDFTFFKYTAFFGLIEVPKGFPEWQLITMFLCLIGSILAYWRTAHNVKVRKQIKEEQEEKYPVAASLGLPMLLLTWLGIEESIWTVMAVVMIGVFVVGVIAMLATENLRRKAAVGLKKAEKDFKKQQAEEQKKQEEAEQKRLEKEEREAELRRKEEKEEAEQRRREEKEEAEQRRREEREDARLQQQMMMQRAMSGGGFGGGGGGGYAAPIYSAPPVVQQVPAQTTTSTDDIVTRVVAALNPTLQSQQAQVQQAQQQAQQAQQQLVQHQQDDKVKALEDKIAQQQQQLAQHQQEQQAQQKDEQFKELKEQFEQQKQQRIEESKLAERQQLTHQQIQQELADKQAKDQAEELARQDEERNQAFTKYMLDRSNQAAKEAEDRKKQQEQEQIKALEEQIQQQKQLIEEMRVQKQEQPTENSEDKTSYLIELLQKSLKELNDRQADDQTKHFEETLKKQEQLIEELRAKSEKSGKDDSTTTLEQLQLMLQKQLEQQKMEQENKLAKQQAEFEQKLQEQQVQRQQELQAQQQEQSRQQIKALEEQLAQQKEAQAKQQEQQEKLLEQQKLEQEKLLEQQKLEQERKLEQQRQEQEKKLEDIKNQKDQAELLAELRSQREPAKQDDATSKILEEHSKTLEQITKQQAEMQAQQKEQEQERLRQEQERQRKELEQKVQEQADEIKELKAKNSTVPSDDDRTAQILEEYSKTLEELAKRQADLQEQQKAKEDAQQQKKLEDIINEQARLIEELRSQMRTGNAQPPDDDKTTKILEQHSKTLEEQGKTLEQIAMQQGKTLERLAEQQSQNPTNNQYQQADLQSQQLARQQAELQARQLAQEQAELQARQNANQQAYLDQQAQQLARQQAELQAQQLARQQAELQAKQLAEQNAKQQELIEQQARQLAQQQNQAESQAQQQAKLLAQRLEQIQQAQQANSVQSQDELKKDNLTKK
jgi:hypothetical protein